MGGKTSDREVGVTDGAKPKPESVPTQCKRGEMGGGEAEGGRPAPALTCEAPAARVWLGDSADGEGGLRGSGAGSGFCRFGGDEAGARFMA